MNDYTNETEWPLARLLDAHSREGDGSGRTPRIRAELDRRANAAEARVRELEAASVALLEALPRCEAPGCTNVAAHGHISHEPHWCEEHTASGYSFRECDWAEPAAALGKLVGR